MVLDFVLFKYVCNLHLFNRDNLNHLFNLKLFNTLHSYIY